VHVRVARAPKRHFKNGRGLRKRVAAVLNWQLETGNWKLEAGSWELETGSRELVRVHLASDKIDA